jgi:ribosomal protein S18 acetylase RimI-like enzyme
MTFNFIQANSDDRAYLLSLRQLTMLEHFEKAGLFLTQKEHEFRLDDTYECMHLIHFDNACIGALKYQETPNIIEIMQLQIHPDFQRRGLGDRVMRELIELAGDKHLTLTVLKSNPALKLYQRLGFVITGDDEYEYWMRK